MSYFVKVWLYGSDSNLRRLLEFVEHCNDTETGCWVSEIMKPSLAVFEQNEICVWIKTNKPSSVLLSYSAPLLRDNLLNKKCLDWLKFSSFSNQWKCFRVPPYSAFLLLPNPFLWRDVNVNRVIILVNLLFLFKWNSLITNKNTVPSTPTHTFCVCLV